MNILNSHTVYRITAFIETQSCVIYHILETHNWIVPHRLSIPPSKTEQIVTIVTQMLYSNDYRHFLIFKYFIINEQLRVDKLCAIDKEMQNIELPNAYLLQTRQIHLNRCTVQNCHIEVDVKISTSIQKKCSHKVVNICKTEIAIFAMLFDGERNYFGCV
jgi:hypothetical protein